MTWRNSLHRALVLRRTIGFGWHFVHVHALLFCLFCFFLGGVNIISTFMALLLNCFDYLKSFIISFLGVVYLNIQGRFYCLGENSRLINDILGRFFFLKRDLYQANFSGGKNYEGGGVKLHHRWKTCIASAILL